MWQKKKKTAYLDEFLKFKVEFCYVTGSGLSGEQNCDERGLRTMKYSLQKL